MLTTTESRFIADDRRFFVGMAAAALALTFAGFATSYYLWPLTRATHYPAGQSISPSVPAIVHIHAVLFTAWILVLSAQASLVATGRTALHRRLGLLAAWLVPLMIVTGLFTAVRGARDGWNPGGPYRDALGFMFVGIADLGVFGVLATAGLAYRRRPLLHKRLMLLATVGGLMWPAITRMPVIAGRFPLMFGALAAIVLATPIRDFWLRLPVRWISLAIGGAVLLTFPLRAVVGNSSWWHAFAAWLIQ